jgi:hypothetical protein
VTVPAVKGSKAAPIVQQMDHTIPTIPIENIYRQASTRGGRPFDSILAGKAQFKDTANVVGDVAMVGAGVAATYAMQSNNSDAAIAALIMLAIAASAKAAAEAAEPNADTRYWDNLPEVVHATTLTLPDSVNRVRIDFLRANGDVVVSRDADIYRAGKCGFAWAREESARPSAPRAPFSAPDDVMMQAVVIPPLPAEPAPAVAGGPPGKIEAGAGVPAQANVAQPENSVDKLKSGFMSLFGSKSAAAAEPKPQSTEKPAAVAPSDEKQPDQKPTE